MRFRREFESPLDPAVALAMTEPLLIEYKFRNVSSGAGDHYQRSLHGAGLFAFHPRQLLANLHLWPAAVEGGSNVVIDLHIQTSGSPKSRLDQAVFEGELDDLQDLLIRSKQPTIDRALQDRAAGNFTIVFAVVLTILCVAVFIAAEQASGRLPAYALTALAFLICVAFYAYLPLRAPVKLRR